MSAALRAVFAEFGIKADTSKLEELDKMVRAAADHLRDARTAEMDFDKVLQGARGPKTAADALKAWGAEQKAQADRLKTLGGIAEKARDDFAGRLGVSAARSNPLIKAFADRLNLTDVELGKMVMTATAAGAAIAALGVHMAFAFGTQFAANAEQLRDVARESRVTTSELQGLDHAAVQAGVGVERMRAGLHTFGEALRQGERWGNGTTSTLRRLGITTRDASGHIRPTVELLDEVAVAMERVESPFRRARVAQHLFGESGRRMLDVLHSGPGGIRALREELEELGGGVTPEAIEASRQFTQAQERQGRALDSVRSVLATALLPKLAWFLNLTARASGELSKLTRGTHVAEVALGAVGIAAATAGAMALAAWVPAVAPFLLAGAAVGALVLVIDDLVGTFEGKDSATRRFIDGIFGEGMTTEVIDGIRGAWQGVGDILDHVSAALDTVSQKLREAREFAAPVIDRVGALAARLGISGTGGVQVAAAPSAGAPVAVPAPATAGGAVRVPAPVGATLAVPAPGFVGQERPARAVKQVTHNPGPIVVNGLTDPERAAQRVSEILEARAREARDADHPREDDD